MLFGLLFLVLSLNLLKQSKGEDLEFSTGVKGFVLRICAERQIDTIYWHFSRNSEGCGFTQDLCDVPIIVSQDCLGDKMYLKGNFNNQILVVLCLNKSNERKELEVIATNLQHMRESPLVLIGQRNYFDMENQQNELEELFKACQKLMFVNVVVLHPNSFISNLYHSYTQMPEFRLERRGLENPIIFPDRVSNFLGKPVLILPDQYEPRTMLYWPHGNDEWRMLGYVGRLLHLFAERYNCTLRFPVNITKDFVVYLHEVRLAVLNGTIDIGASGSSPQRLMNIHDYTYPFEIMKWLTMLPVENEIPRNILMFSTFEVSLFLVLILQSCCLSVLLCLDRRNEESTNGCYAFLAHVVLNDTVLRGVCGLPFQTKQRIRPFRKYLYFLLFCLGLFVSTSYTANMMESFTKSRFEPEIKSFNDTRARGLKIYHSPEEIESIKFFRGEKFWRDNKDIFVEARSFAEFQAFRHEFNTNYGYTMTTSVWHIVNVQQKYFSRKLFRLSHELYYSSHLIIGMPINENSIYRQPLNEFLSHIREHGFLRHYFAMTFYDMVSLKRLKMEDISRKSEYKYLSLNDFFYLWIGFCVLSSISIVIFVFEILCHRKMSKQ